jgi:hypothetical protein
LRISLRDPPQQREAAPLAVHRELTRGEADVLAMTVSGLPDGKSHELQAIELSAGEMNLGVPQLATWD